jgi:hypothetical protein
MTLLSSAIGSEISFESTIELTGNKEKLGILETMMKKISITE